MRRLNPSQVRSAWLTYSQKLSQQSIPMSLSGRKRPWLLRPGSSILMSIVNGTRSPTSPSSRRKKGAANNAPLRHSRPWPTRPLVASNISVGALFRAIDEAGPTLLIDEADTYLGRSSTMRGILNCGNTRRTAYVLRLAKIGQRQPKGEADEEDDRGSSVVRYSCWCPKAIAMIGKVPETLADRSIVVNMQRKLTAEKCAPLADFNPALIVQKCARWSLDEEQKVADWPRLGNEKLTTAPAIRTSHFSSSGPWPVARGGQKSGTPLRFSVPSKTRNRMQPRLYSTSWASSSPRKPKGSSARTSPKPSKANPAGSPTTSPAAKLSPEFGHRTKVAPLQYQAHNRPNRPKSQQRLQWSSSWARWSTMSKEEVRLKLAELREMNNLAREAEAEQNAQKELQKGGVTGVAEPLKARFT